MEQNELKSVWQQKSHVSRSNDELLSMMQERNHPVLKSIRRQLIIEIVLYSLLLFVYYDFFDGDRRPLYANMLLVAAALLSLAHNLAGYGITKSNMNGESLRHSLVNQLARLKKYAAVSVSARLLFAVCLLFFFTSVITFDDKKYWLLAGLASVFVVQIIILSGIWRGRIKQLKETIDSFNS